MTERPRRLARAPLAAVHRAADASDVAGRLEAALAPYREAFPGARWQHPDAFHVTLRFLGSTPPERVDALTLGMARCGARSQLASGWRPTAVTGSSADPGGVAWLRIGTGGAQVGSLARCLVEDACADDPRIPDRGSAPAPHVTIARRADRALIDALGRRSLGDVVGGLARGPDRALPLAYRDPGRIELRAPRRGALCDPDAIVMSSSGPRLAERGAVVRTQGLRKTYGRHVALESLDLRVGPGQVIGLLGPNGAGKTTAVKLLLGLVAAHRGGGTLLGRPLGDRRAPLVRGVSAGAVPVSPVAVGAGGRARSTASWPACRARLAGMDRPGARHRRPRRIGRRTGSGTFSKGMQQRLGLGLALLGDPQLVILDEPTSALDPVGRDDVRTIIRDRPRTGCIRDPQLASAGRGGARLRRGHHRPPRPGHRGRRLAPLLGAPSLRVVVSGLADPVSLLQRFAPVHPDADRLVLQPTRPGTNADVVAAVVAAGGRVHVVEPVQRSLEDLFLELVRSGVTETTESFRLPSISPP